MLPRWLLTIIGFAAATHLRGAEKVEHGGLVYHVHRIDKAALAGLELRWLGANGKPLATLEDLQKQVAAEGKSIAFATNAGIYEIKELLPTPCGLTIVDGKELVPLNLRKGDGNFYMQPNGVFFVDPDKGAGILESSDYAAAGLKPRIAAQSGPLLLRKGVIHPAFNAPSKNRKQRSGVGIRAADGQVIFVVSDRVGASGQMNFHTFASFFLHLGCKDALFLDGDISEMVTNPAADAKFTPNTFAAMFVVRK